MQKNKSIFDEFYKAIELPVGVIHDLEESKIGIPIDKQSIFQEELYESVVSIFEQKQCSSVAVVEDNKPLGIITLQDFVKKVELPQFKRCGAEVEIKFSQISAHDLMSDKVESIDVNSSIKSAMLVTSSKKFRHLPVVNDNGEYLFTLDLRLIIFYLLPIFADYINEEQVVEGWSNVTVNEYKSILAEDYNLKEGGLDLGLLFNSKLKRIIDRRPLILDISATVADAIELLRHGQRSALLVTEFETQLMGIITQRDLVGKFFSQIDLLRKADHLRLEDFMTKNPHMLLGKHTVGNALSNIARFKYRSIILVDEDKLALSVIELRDIFKFLVYHLVKPREDEV